MSENFYAGRKELLKKDIQKTLKCATLIATVLVPVLFTCGQDLGVLLYGNALSGRIIRDYAFMLLPMCISMITTTVLNSMQHEIRTLIYFFVGAIIMLACIFAFTKYIGIDAYMVGQTLNLTVTAALNLRLLKKSCSADVVGAHTIKCTLICLAACVFGKLFINLLSNTNIILRIIICGGGAGGFALLAFYGMEMLSAYPIKKIFTRG